MTIDVRGSALKAAIENGLSRLPAPSGRFPQIAGLKIEADPSRPAGNRVLSIKVGNTPLDANKTHSVATIDLSRSSRARRQGDDCGPSACAAIARGGLGPRRSGCSSGAFSSP